MRYFLIAVNTLGTVALVALLILAVVDVYAIKHQDFQVACLGRDIISWGPNTRVKKEHLDEFLRSAQNFCDEIHPWLTWPNE